MTVLVGLVYISGAGDPAPTNQPDYWRRGETWLEWREDAWRKVVTARDNWAATLSAFDARLAP